MFSGRKSVEARREIHEYRADIWARAREIPMGSCKAKMTCLQKQIEIQEFKNASCTCMKCWKISWKTVKIIWRMTLCDWKEKGRRKKEEELGLEA